MDGESIDWGAVTQIVQTYHVTEIALAVAGVVALFIVRQYLKDRDSAGYKLSVAAGVVAGVALIAVTYMSHELLETSTVVIVGVAAFTLLIRPIRDTNVALIISMLIMVVAYMGLGKATGDLEFLASGWPRAAVAFAGGAVFYMLTTFLQDMVQMVGKILNAWPLLAVCGLLFIAEAVSVYMGYGSVWDMVQGLIAEHGAEAAASCAMVKL